MLSFYDVYFEILIEHPKPCCVLVLVNIVRIYNIHKDAFVILCYFGVVYRRFGFVQMYLGHVWSILLASTQFALIQLVLSVNTL